MFWEHGTEKPNFSFGFREYMRQHDICLKSSLHGEVGQDILGREETSA